MNHSPVKEFRPADLAQPISRTTPDLDQVCPEIREMIVLIHPVGFAMMGAFNLTFNNETYSLAWQMGSGAACRAVLFSYQPSRDLYKLEFIQTAFTERTSFEHVYVEDVISLIEQETGFYLRL